MFEKQDTVVDIDGAAEQSLSCGARTNGKIKIAFINDIVYGYASKASWAVGGAERYQWLLARALARRGWSVVVGVREAMQPGEHRVVEGVRFQAMERGHILSAWYKFLRRQQPHWWYWQAADHLWGAAVEIAKLTRTRTIYSAALDSDVDPRRALSRRRSWWPLYAWGLARTDKIFVQHHGQLAGLPARWRAKASVLPSVVAKLSRVKSHRERERFVAWVAVLRQVKRPDRLIEIAARLPHVRFVVCGGPSSHRSPPGYGEWAVQALKEQPNIEYLGKVSPKKALEIISEASLLLSTSDQEGFPSTFLEAWAAGTPVVSLKIDPDGVIERFQLGRVTGSVENAAQSILELVDSPEKREEIQRRARRYVAGAHGGAAVVRVFERNLPFFNGASR